MGGIKIDTTVNIADVLLTLLLAVVGWMATSARSFARRVYREHRLMWFDYLRRRDKGNV